GHVQRWLLVGLVAYLFGIWAFAERTVERALTAVRPAVRIGDAEFRRYERGMETLPVVSELALVIASLVLSALLFVVLRAELLVDDPVTHHPSSLPLSLAGIVILAGYTVIGWAFLRLVYG